VRSLVDTRGWSSAHVLFPSAEETEELVAAGLVHRTSLQFHWNNAGYASFDDFLSRFRAKRRAQIRRERRALLEQGISLETRTGKNIDEEVVEAVFRFYRSTVEAKFPWGRQYLNRDFFFRICDTMPSRIHIVLARQRVSQRCVGGALNLLGDRVLYGRYWGATEHRAFLHFNVCYYHGIEECIVRNLSRFEPGAGGEHKLARGFVPAETHSAHYLRDPVLDAAVRDFTRRERAAVRAAIARWKLGYRG
jgi:hypothetical protein